MNTHNFSAGPAVLPQPVLAKASAAVIEFNHSGMSLLEISHRSKDFMAVMEKAKQLVKELLGVPDGYSILFLQGGASLQFAMVPYNLLPEGGTAAYINTGVWATKAVKEAELFGNTQVVASSKDRNFCYIPKGFSIPSTSAYLHLTTNNTIYGTQYKTFPQSPVAVVADMSSDIFSKKVNVADFALIYAGAQKNMGPAGATLVIVKDDILGKTGRKIPSMLDYRVHIEGESLYNTPAVFSIYVSMLTLEWLKDNGGLSWIERVNEQKAALFYSELDANHAFKAIADVADRSLMNATFVLKDETLEPEFTKMLKEANIIGLKGHRSAGGFRASMYNALPLESVKVLTDVMKEFGKKFG